MQRVLPGFVKCGLKAVWSRVVDRLREWTKPDNHGLVGGAVADATRSKPELMLENALLRQQLIVLDRQVKRPQLNWQEHRIMVLLASKLRGWKDALLIVQPAGYRATLASRSIPAGVAAQITTRATRRTTSVVGTGGAAHPTHSA